MKNYDELMINSHDSETLYRFSPMRFNIVSWYSFKPETSAVIVGEECPVFADFLEERGKITRTVYLDEIDFLKYEDRADYIFFLGLVDEAVLKKAKEMLSDDGALFIAVDNRTGLMYQAGLPYFQTGRPFDSIKLKKDNHCATRLELQGLLSSAEINDCDWYFPYPDFRLAEEIYSLDHMPSKNLVQGNFPSYKGDYQIFADPSLLYKKAFEEGRTVDVMNSFLLVWSKKKNPKNTLEYAKFNWHRAPQFRLGTLIRKDESGRVVEKFPMCREACTRLDVIEKNGLLLSDNFNMLTMVPFKRISAERLQFKFVEGTSLIGNVDFYNIKMEKLKAVVETSMLTIFSTENHNIRPFEPTEEFKLVFGQINTDLFINTDALKVSNPDSIFDNFIMGDEIYCLDYEWCFDFPVPVKYLKYRTLHYLYRENERELKQQKIFEEDFLKNFDYTVEEIKTCEALELAFQQFVHGADLKYIYLPHYRWRALSKEEWKSEKTIGARIKRKLGFK